MASPPSSATITQDEQQGSKMNGQQQQQPVVAKLVGLDQLAECGERLRQGNLVAFPTETVYGLGCNALDESACRKVFAAKERPLTDPLIVHVTHPEIAYNQLWANDDDDETTTTSLSSLVLRRLCESFWPGPLTLVARAGPTVPPVVMAGTGFVACRSPHHAVARALIEAAQVPIAAPSANKFGHVSPTTAQHVYDDLHAEDVWIVDASEHDDNGDSFFLVEDRNGSGSCHVGVESSVVKLEMLPDDRARLTMLRQGAVSTHQLQACLRRHGWDSDTVEVQSHFKQTFADQESTVSPGQTLRHYSPNVPSFLVSQACVQQEVETSLLQSAVVIDYGQQLRCWQAHALAYRDLSAAGHASEAAQHVFETLRWAESVPGVSRVLFPRDICVVANAATEEDDGLALAVQDRLTRAASGKVLHRLDDDAERDDPKQQQHS